ncbi:uncharacterized protein [Battus philenor]|uniref:uncharacterized protein n=1 Tax=Battus philenor TaxID=42288 RepID=UPI0035CFCAF7
MTSHTIEKSHKKDLQQLLDESGLTCVRSMLESEESSGVSVETENKVPSKELEEEMTDMEVEEESVFMTELREEQGPEIFPSPSLRRVLSDRIRMIEKHNQIHVLPEKFNTQIDPLRIPKISTTPAQGYIDELADITGCKTYKSSLAEYWFLDTLANLLRRAQEDGLDKPTQAVLIHWFCEWMKEMQHFDAASRPRMLRRFKETMLSAAGYVVTEDKLPLPLDVGVTYKAEEYFNISHPSPTPVDSAHFVTFEGFQCCLFDLIKILHYIFDLFSSDFQYDLIRSVFTFTPEYQLIDAPHKLQSPKRLFTPYKDKEQKDKKGKKKEVDTEEYLHLLSLQADIEREKEEETEKQREQFHRRNHLLPLSFAITDEFFDKYWPPPTPEIIEEPEPEPKGKGKGKKK